jgi:hypothetical protein
MAGDKENIGIFKEPLILPATEADILATSYADKTSFSFSAKQSTMELVAFTNPDAYKNIIGDVVELPYQRILALWHKDGFFGEHIGQDTSDLAERVLRLPSEMGQRLLEGMRAVTDPSQSVNCHYFGRLMSGLKLDHDAPFLAANGVKTESALALGQLGIIASLDEYPDHSIIGLGEEVDESLQVISGFGELGIAGNADVLEFYRELKQNPEKHIFAAPRALAQLR